MAKEPSEAQIAARQKFAEAARARAAEAREKKEAENLDLVLSAEASGDLNPEPLEEASITPEVPADAPQEIPEPTDPGPAKNPEVEDLKRMVMELQAAMFVQNQAPTGQVLNRTGGITGTLERYSLKPEDYPDPRDRLKKEKRLEQVAFEYNYELLYSCNPTRRYQTVDGHWQRDPQFNLELVKIMRDEVTGEATNGRYTICRGIFFEDPDSAVITAGEMGIPIDEENEKAFLDEMRYLRYRDWLLEAFYPAVPTGPRTNKREMVIGGKQVEYWEINSENAEVIPFGTLKSKVG